MTDTVNTTDAHLLVSGSLRIPADEVTRVGETMADAAIAAPIGAAEADVADALRTFAAVLGVTTFETSIRFSLAGGLDLATAPDPEPEGEGGPA